MEMEGHSHEEHMLVTDSNLPDGVPAVTGAHKGSMRIHLAHLSKGWLVRWGAGPWPVLRI